ncbi:ABC transporter ATP-binding protein [Paenibacillus macerans]|uniref:ABC transporter ATP-binding protein n=1 Tax=Paenibacillus macerans TaxID=44252 RepID=UPI000EB8BF71|nr:ABC transporter ATP-binding protein [Paenibacillus macerans]MEC0140177.1 ABC transporter ATP-binding protein [Paenibacillus macerans]GBK62935.1 ABC transporter ATP-binding protein [Paenibacillus macerans]GBK69247.1 ABC transporter ATP-binding protein [Paenibacillus macerans]GIP12020.1 ABC transporter ATP-binding protein [Paenibacillus macerans]
MQPKIEISGVSKWFRRNGQEIPAMRETSLTIEEGLFVSMIGPSGCGKSTLFNIIAGLIPPSTGQVIADGRNIVGKTGYVGYMLQKDMLLPWRTILDNIILGMEVRGVPRKEAAERALPLMEKYGLKGFDKHYPQELSGGMRQRAALLRTLLYDRDIILLDEPFGALDAQTRLTMQNWLLQIWTDFGKTVLFVTHDIDEAIYLSDDIYVFSQRPGRVKSKITVTMERPRKTEDMTSPDFMELKHHLLDELAAGHAEEDIAL